MSESRKCPRCHEECVELGVPIVKVGKTREARVRVLECPKCLLVFYEAVKE